MTTCSSRDAGRFRPGPFGSNPQDWTIMSWIGNVKWLEISGSQSVHDCGCAEGPSVDTQIHHARNSPHCVLLVSSFAVRSSQLTLLEPGEGFGFHLTAIPGHENTVFLSTEGIEEIFIFDWFMDCNVGFFTNVEQIELVWVITVSRRRDRCRPSGRTTRLLRHGSWTSLSWTLGDSLKKALEFMAHGKGTDGPSSSLFTKRQQAQAQHHVFHSLEL